MRKNISSGAPWEAEVGYSRAVRVGNLVEVAGTTAVENGNIMYPGDAYRQSQLIFQKLKAALEAAGASLQDVVRTRMYVTDISRWEEVGKAHGEVFREVRPASTMVEVSRLIHEDLVVEIELSAICD
jgi:enamine deaminase RidA (YjgF/YER057c/UK114 family)